MKNIIIKIFSILVMLIMLLEFNVVEASDIGGVTINPNTGDSISTKVGDIGNIILGVIQVVGTAVAVGMILILGIKYMTSAAEERASIKKSLVQYTIGAIVLFAAVNIVKIIYTFATSAITS